MRDLNKWDYRYMKIADDVSRWSTCLSRQIGCIITVENRIVATGYNGAPSGITTCLETGRCLRQGSPSGTNLENCLAAHAEQNALMQAAKQGVSIKGGALYCTASPCTTCAKMLINAGIKEIFFFDQYPNDLSLYLLGAAKIDLYQMEREKCR